MMIQLRPRNRRALLVMASALVIYTALKVVAFPVLDRLNAAAATASQKQDELRRLRRAESRKGQYAPLTDIETKRLKEAESVLVAATNVSLVSAELQSLLETAGSKVGITFGQRSMGNPKRLNDFYSEVPMTLAFECTPGQLVALLSELRSAPKFISIHSVQVSPIQPVQEAPKNGDLSKNIRTTMTLAVLSTAEMAVK